MTPEEAGLKEQKQNSGYHYFWLALILVLAALLRAWYLYEVLGAPDYAELRQDMSVQDYHARAILTGDWTLPEGRSDPRIAETPYYRPPAYSYLLSALYIFSGGSYFAPRLLNVILGLLSIVLMFRLGKLMFGAVPGLIAAALMATYWGFIYYEGEVNDPAVFVFLLPCLLLSLHQWKLTWSVRWIALAACITGCYALMRPNILLYGPAMAAWLLMVGWRAGKYRETALAWLALAGVTLLTIAPVTARNYIVSGEFVPISTYFGENLYIGNCEYADGYTSWTPYLQELEGSGQFSVWEYDRIVKGLGREVGNENLTHSEASSIFLHKALDWMGAHKWETLKLTLKKAVLFWSPWEITENKVVHYEKLHYPPLKYLPGFPYVLALFLFGTILILNEWRKGRFSGLENADARDLLLLVYGLIIIYWASFWLFFVNARARHPLVGFLFLIGAFGLYRSWEMLRTRGLRGFVPLLVLLGVLFGVASLEIIPYTPDHARWHYARADSWLRSGEVEKAKQEAESMLTLEYSLYMPFRLGHGFAQKGEYKLAERLLRAAMGAHPEEQPVLYVQDLYFHLGVVLSEDGRSDEAKAAFEEALRLNPEDSRAHNDLAVLLEKEGLLEAAMEHYRAALEANPDFMLALGNYGDLLGRLGRHDEAVAIFRQALEEEQDSPLIRYNLAVQLMAMGRTDQATAEYEALLETWPKEFRALNNLGFLLAEQGRTGEAEALYRRALEVNPEFTLARANLGNLLIQQGKFEAGVKVYEEGIALNPEDTELLNGLGYHYAQHGGFDRAKILYEEALKIDSGFSPARINLAYLLLHMQEIEPAMEQFVSLLERDPDNPEFLLELGNLYARKNRFSEAVDLYNRALAVKPDFEAARNNLEAVQSLRQ